MKKRFTITALTTITLILNACGNNLPTTQLPLSEQDQVATLVATMLSAITPPAPVPASTSTPDSSIELSINGVLQGELAFIRNGNLWISINGVESQLTTDATGLPELWYSNPQISPDGTKIAYLKNSGYDARTLMLYDMTGRNATQLVTDVAWAPPVMEWSNDSQKIYYLVSTGFDVTTGLETLAVSRIDLVTGQIQGQGSYGVQTGCGGGSSDPADHLSSDENLYGSTGGGYIFELMPQGNYLLHSIICSGGLGVLDLSNNQDRPLDSSIKGAAISPDGSRIAAISDNNIIIFNASTWTIENTLPTLETPRALLWNANNTGVLYSTSKPANTITLDDNLALDLFGGAPISYKLNTSTLWMMSLETGQSSKIIEMDAHDLKLIFTKGNKALVAVVENSNELYDYITQGNRENLPEHYPDVNIVEVDLINLNSSLLTNQTRQVSFWYR